jgi:DNA-nicking Smr family endonuclease
MDEPIDLEITDSIDLHAFSPEDVKAVTIAYLDEARKNGFTLVRIIHGKGSACSERSFGACLKRLIS